MSDTAPKIHEIPEQSTAVVRGEVPGSDLPAFFDRSFGALATALQRQGIAPAGAAFARYDEPPGEIVRLEVGFPTASPIEPDGEVEAGTLPAGRVARTTHAGSFEDLGATWSALGDWIAEQGEQPGDTFWEVYVTEPSPEMDPAELRTELSWLLR